MAKTKKEKKTEDKAVKDEVLGEAGKAINTKEQEKASKSEKKNLPKRKRRLSAKVALMKILTQAPTRTVNPKKKL